MTFTVRKFLWLTMLTLVVGCQGTKANGTEADSRPHAAEGASRLALARQADDLVLVEINLDDETHEVLTSPVSNWFRKQEGYTVLGPSARLWASRDHARAVMFGRPHDGGERKLYVLRAGEWAPLTEIEDLRDVVVAPSARLIVTNTSERAEPFSEGMLHVFDYEGRELCVVKSRRGLSTVALAPDGSWVLVEDEGDAVIVHQDGRTVRFEPELGPAGETQLGWAVSAVFEDRIVFHGYAEDSAGDVIYPRVAHKTDGTKVPSELTDYERIQDNFVLTPDRKLYAVSSEGFVLASKLPSDFALEEHTFIVSDGDLTLSSSRTELSWLDVNGKVAASYSPEVMQGFNRFVIRGTAVHSVRSGLCLLSHETERDDSPTSTIEAFTWEAGKVKAERVMTLPVATRTLHFGIKPDSPWIAWAVVDDEQADDFASAYNVETRKRANLDDLPTIESWADYGAPSAHAGRTRP